MNAVADKLWQGIENSLLMAYEVWWRVPRATTSSARWNSTTSWS
ncbi:MAG: hypothetical protein WD118_07215 [Phycisphaeraceae bacterium]